MGDTKILCYGLLMCCIVVFTLMAFVIYFLEDYIVAFFTDDDDVKESCKEIWWMISMLCFNMSLYCINMGLSYGLVMHWPLGVLTIVCLWVFGYPMAYWNRQATDDGISGIWQWINPAYFLMNVSLMVIFVISDWDKVAAGIREREGIESEQDNDLTESLLVSSMRSNSLRLSVRSTF